MSQKITVCILFGGQSSEHEVSRISATSVIENIDKEKYDIVMIGITKDGSWLLYQGDVDKIATGEWEGSYSDKAIISPDALISGIVKMREDSDSFELMATRARIDVVFPVLHGLYGEDGTIQGLLELAKVPYVGAGVISSALAMDKAYAKIIFQSLSIPQADWITISINDLNNIDDTVKKIESKFTYPCFIKPSNTGSSIGISKPCNKEELIKGLKLAAKYDKKILIEEFIDGREIECSVLGNEEPKTSVLGEIIPGKEFYDYEAKYKDKTSQLIIPAELNSDTESEIKEYAIKAYQSIECKGLARVDFFVHRKTGKIYLNELNTMPGFTEISMYPKLWAASGLSYTALLDTLIQLAINKNK